MAVANEVGFCFKQKIEIQLGESRNDLNKVLAAYEAGFSHEGGGMMSSSTAAIWLPPSRLQSRLDGNFNSAAAFAARSRVQDYGSVRTLEQVAAEMRCGPFGSTMHCVRTLF